jgi:steroid delta-isomerase-like uncharacterized protein
MNMNKLTTICVVLVFFFLSVCTQAIALEPAELIAIRDAADAALNAHDLDTMMSYWTDDGVYDYVPLPDPFMGKEAVRSFFEALFVGFPDFGTTEGRVLAADNIVVVEHSTTSSAHLGEWMGIPPTGNPASAPHIDIYEFEGDKIKQGTTYLDATSVMVQLGVMPAPELDPALLVPSFTVPEAEPSGLTPLEAFQELLARWNAQDLPGFAKMFHPDAEIYDTGLGVPVNRDAYVAAQEMNFQGFSDMRGEIVRVIDMGDGWVLREVVFTGTHDGPFMGFPATGRTCTLRGAGLLRFDADGLVTNFSLYYDNITVMAQLGLFPPPDPEANKALVGRYVEEVWHQGNLDAADEMVAPDFVGHFPEGEAIGIEGAKEHVIAFRTPFPDIHFTIEDMIAEGDKVAARLTFDGTHTGEMMGIPPTGVQTTVTGIFILQIGDGKLVEVWSIVDMLGIMQQLGVMPATHEGYTWGAPSEVTGEPGDLVTNTALVLYLTEKFWNQKNVNVLDEIHSTDSIAHNPIIPGNPLPFYVYKQVALIYLSAFPDMRVTTDDIIAEGDKVVIRWTANGTHQGELMGIPASGRKVTWTGMTINRFADGKIVENWWAYDALGMMQQIMPPMPEPPEE